MEVEPRSSQAEAQGSNSQAVEAFSSNSQAVEAVAIDVFVGVKRDRCKYLRYVITLISLGLIIPWAVALVVWISTYERCFTYGVVTNVQNITRNHDNITVY